MGARGSCHAATVSEASSSKVIMENGELKEFLGAVKAGVVLGNSSGFFVCNSDDMEFEDYLTAVRRDEELRPGRLYFVLPLSMLKRRLQLEELAALAVKASAALVRAGGAAAVPGVCEVKEGCIDGDYGRKVAPVEGSFGVSTGGRTKRRENRRPSGRQFRSKLTAIAE